MGLANGGCAAFNALFPYNSHILQAKILSIHHCPVTGVLLPLEINNGEYMFLNFSQESAYFVLILVAVVACIAFL